MEPKIVIVNKDNMSLKELEKNTMKALLFSTNRTLDNYDNVIIQKENGVVKGVFASKYIEKGTIITRFPVHYFTVKTSENTYDFYPSPQVLNAGLSARLECHNCTFHIRGIYGICGDPAINNDIRYAGHLIRNNFQILTPENSEYDKDQERIFNEFVLKQNCIIIFDENNIEAGIFIIAIRDIAKDEELFIHNDYAFVQEYSKAINNQKK